MAILQNFTQPPPDFFGLIAPEIVQAIVLSSEHCFGSQTKTIATFLSSMRIFGNIDIAGSLNLMVYFGLLSLMKGRC